MILKIVSFIMILKFLIDSYTCIDNISYKQVVNIVIKTFLDKQIGKYFGKYQKGYHERLHFTFSPLRSKNVF